MNYEELRNSIKGNELDSIKDRVLRSEGALRYAYMMSSSEFMKHFSNVRLGIALGIITDISYVTLGTLLVESLPATLSLSENIEKSTGTERDMARAKLIKSKLA